MATYFITIGAHLKRNLFQRDGVAELMVATFLKCRDAGEFELHEYVVMPNHVHLLLSINAQQRLGLVVQVIKVGFSHSLRQNGIMVRTVWEERCHHRCVRDNNEFAECVRYIRQNPVQKGLVASAEEYPYSSAGQGLKSPGTNEGKGDANLKVRSTDPTDKADAGLKPRLMEFLETLGTRT